MQQCQQMGFDLYQVQDWLMTRGICEAQQNIVIDQINNPGYQNVLRPQVMQVQPQMMQGMPQQQPMQGMPVNPMAQMMGQQMIG